VSAAVAGRDVTVGRLRVRGGGDELRLRLHVARLLASADVATGRLPPGAVLVVRRLDDPLPRGLDPRAVSAAPAWERAARAALGACAAGAARPARGAVAADADAVVFADRAELLATLAANWCDTSLGAWWWRALGIDGLPALLRAFGETPEAMPAALDVLARGSSLPAFAARLPAAAAAMLARAAGAAFGAAAAVEAALAEPRQNEAAPQTRQAERAESAGRPAVPPPWHEHTAALPGLTALAPEAQVLAGIAVALRRRPAAVRAPSFAAGARAWRAALSAPAAAIAAAPGGALRHAASAAPADADRSEIASARPAQADSRSGRADRGPDPERAGAGAKPAASGRGGGATVPAPPVGGTAEPRARAAATAASPASAARSAPARSVTETTSDPAGELALALDTRLGGIFHLVLVGQSIGLYGDFMSPARPGIALDVWDFVTLVGRRLLGRPPRDPLWGLLAQLAGRGPDQTPGRGFRPPRTWRVPRRRLAPFTSAGTWRYAERDGRLLLLHPAGFAVLDAAGADLERELRRYRATCPRRSAWPGAHTTPLDRWSAHVTGYVRARLAAALGVSARRAAPLALRRPARVLVTDTGIDVVSSLADLPIEVRLACLDRDPGFIPATGRSLRFHFQ
jgi:hypothetical protein